MITWGLISALTAFVWNAESLGVARFLLGLAEAGYFPGLVLFLMAWLPNEYRARFIGSLIAVGALSIIIGNPISGWIMSLGPIAGLQNWQWLFLLEGLPAAAIGVAILIWLPETPQLVPWLTAAEKVWLTQRLAAERNAKETMRTYSLRDTLFSAKVWAVGLAIFPIGATTYGLLAWLPQVVKGFGLTSIQTGVVSALPFIVTIVVMLLWSAHSDRTQERPWHIFFPAAWGSVGLVIAATYPPGIVSLIGITLGITGLWSSLTILFTVLPGFLTGTAAALGTAFVTAVGNVGSFIGPYLIGWVKDHGGSDGSSLLIFAAMTAGTALLGLSLKIRQLERRA
jgi:ACS family tartrate transporter-like MFS transporter